MRNAPKKADGTIDWTEWILQDPEAALAARDQAVMQGLRQEYQQVRGREKFWDQFYGQHADLRPEQALVERVLATHYGDLSKIAVSDAIEQLAELSRQEIAAETQRRTRQTEYSVFRGGPGLGANEVPVPPSDEGTLGSEIRRRRQRRREVQMGYVGSRAAAE